MPLVSPDCLPPSEHSRGLSVQDSGSPQPSWALRFLLVSFGLAAGLVLARYVLKQVDLSAVSVLLRGLSPALLFGLVCLELSIHLTKAGRWRLLQAADRPPAFIDAFAAQTIGCLANILFPLRTDDLARTAVLARRTQQPLLRVAGATLVDRLFDLASVCLLAFLVSPGILSRVTGLPPAVATAIVLVGGIATLLLLRRLAPVGNGEGSSLPGGRISRMLFELSAAARSLPRGRRLTGVLVLLALEWGAMFAMFGLAASAFLEGPSVFVVAGMVLANYAAFLVPAAPGAVGVFEAAQLGMLAGRPESPEVLAALVLLLHVNLLVPVALLGIGFGLGEVRRRPRTLSQSPDKDTTN